MTFEKLLRRCFYEALALYDAYYERMANLGNKHARLGDALPIAWVLLVKGERSLNPLLQAGNHFLHARNRSLHAGGRSLRVR